MKNWIKNKFFELVCFFLKKKEDAYEISAPSFLPLEEQFGEPNEPQTYYDGFSPIYTYEHEYARQWGLKDVSCTVKDLLRMGDPKVLNLIFEEDLNSLDECERFYFNEQTAKLIGLI